MDLSPTRLFLIFIFVILAIPLSAVAVVVFFIVKNKSSKPQINPPENP